MYQNQHEKITQKQTEQVQKTSQESFFTRVKMSKTASYLLRVLSIKKGLKIREKFVFPNQNDIRLSLKGRTSLLVALLVLAVLIPAAYFLTLKPHSAGAWWNDNWMYRKPIEVTNSSGDTLTNYQVEVLSNVDMSNDVTAGKLQSDLDDLRFTDINGKLLDYWIDDDTTSSLNVWVKMASIPASGTTVYLYYGNPSAEDNRVTIGTNNFPALSCKAINNNGDSNGDGIYWLTPTNDEDDKIQSYCDMTTQSGGWTLAFQRRGGSNSVESCGSNLNTFLHNTCGSVSDLGYSSSYNINIDNLTGYSAPSYLFYQFDSNLTKDTDDAFTVNTTGNIFPGNTGVMNNTAVTSICDIDGANCDSTDAFFKYTGDGWYGSAQCNSGYSAGSYKGNYGYCQNGVSAAYTSNGLFGNRDGYNETKLWNYGSGTGRDYMEQVFIRETTLTYSASANTPGSEEESEGPIAYWSFDEGYGTEAHDSSQNGNDGTFGTGSLAPTWQNQEACLSGNCLYFDEAENQKITISDRSPDMLDIRLKDLTISAWIRTSMADGQDRRIVAKGIYPGYFIYMTNGRIYASIGKSDPSARLTAASTDTVNDNQWHHVVGVFDRDGNSQVYIDGLANGSPVDISSYSAIDIDYAGTFSIGYYDDNHDWKGFIDEVKIYPYARSAEQIKADFISANTQHGTSTVLGSNTIGGTLSNGLVGYWKMDENTGTTLSDSSGIGNTGAFGTGGSAPGWTSGMYGTGLSFDGSSAYTTISDNDSLDLTEHVTISAWIKIGGTGAFQGIVAKDDGVWTSGANNYQFLVNTGNKLEGRYLNSDLSKTYWYGDTSLSADQWYHALYQFSKNVDNTYKLSLYLNGEKENTTCFYKGGGGEGDWLATNCNSVSVIPEATSDPLYIGWYGISSVTHFNGLIDEVRIYNRTLSPKEVRDLYNWAPGPVGYWKFDEGTGTTTVNDSSGNNYTATMNGSMTNSDWTPAKYGYGLNTDTNDYLSTSLSMTGWSQGTYSMWVKNLNVSDSNYGYLFQAASGCNEGVPLIRDTDNMRYFINSSTQEVYFSTANNSLILNRWQYLAVTWDSSSVKMYIDGVFAGSDTAVNFSNTSNFATPRLGGGYCDSYNDEVVDDVKIYNYARTQKQIVSDMNAGHPAVGSPIASAVARWDFDEGYGTTVNNIGNGGVGLSGVLSGGTAPTWSGDGKFDKALSFNGNDSYVNVPETNTLDPLTGSLTASAWINIKTIPVVHDIIVQKGATSQGQPGYWFGVATSGKLDIALSDGTNWIANFVSGEKIVADNNWHHVAFTWDPNSGINLYVDGVLDKSISVVSTASINATQTFKIGGYSSANYTVDGLIDEVKVYNYALTEDEIKLDYNFGKAIVLGANSVGTGNTAPNTASSQAYCIPGDTSTCSPPVAEWNFEEGTGALAQDTSGNGNTGTFGTGNSAPAWSNGKIGNALKFDGSNDYVSIPTSGSLDIGTSSFTVEFWMNANELPSLMDILGQGGGSSGGGWRTTVRGNSSLEFSITDEEGRISWLNISHSLSTNQWHHLAFTAQPGSATGLKYYQDGILKDTKDISSIDSSINTASSLLFGDTTASIQNFNGLLDQIKIYRYVRTPAQVAWGYNRGAPVGHWDLNECQGTIAYDASGLGNTGMITIGSSGSQSSPGTCAASAATAWYNGANGKYNASLNFDGTDDYVNNNTQLVGAYPFTMSAWIKTTESAAGSIISIQDKDATSIQYGIFSYTYAVARARNTTARDATSLTQVNDGNWHLITGIFISDNSRKIYVDGKVEAENTDSATYNSAVDSWDIGRFGDSTPNGYFSGQIDDARIYNYALTAEQVKQLYNQGSAVRFGE